MKDDFFWQDEEDANETKELIARFDGMIANGDIQFFDLDDFEMAVDLYINKAEYEKADKAIAIGLHLYPNAITLNVKKGECYYIQGELNKALDVLTKAAYVDNRNPDLLALIGTIYSQQHESKKAIKFFERALLCSPDELDNIYIDLAAEYQFSNEYPKAIEVLKKALVENPKNEAAIFDLYHCYSFTKELDKCLEYFHNFIDNYPYSFSGWYNLGMCFLKQDKLDEAINAFQFCVVIEKNIYLPYHQIASIYYDKEDYIKALEVYKDCLEIDEQCSMTYTYIGECYEKLEEFELAEVNYKQAIKLNENASEAWLGLGIVKTLMKEPKLSIPFFEKAIAIDKDNSFYWFQLADTYHYELDMPEKAKEGYKESLELYGDDHYAWVNYLELLLKSFPQQEAFDAVIEATTFSCNKEHLHYMVAACHLKSRDFEACESALEKGLLEYPKNISTFLDLTESRDLTQPILDLIDLHKK